MNGSVVGVARQIISKFPCLHLTYCFCYGSGVFRQASKTSNSMLDMIFVVNNPRNFHEENLQNNSSHYSAVKYFGSSTITKIQQDWGAKLYYNTLIPHEEGNITYKYGIISRDSFVTDLLDWSDLYIAGRLHKPVVSLTESQDNDLLAALRLNLYSAVHVALLILPEHFTEAEFYQALANISYSGDFRMWFGEDKNKVNNIVVPQIEYFRELYSSIIATLGDFMYIPENHIGRNCQQNISPEARWHHLNNLPRSPQKKLIKYFNKQSRSRQDAEEVLRTLSYDPDVGYRLAKCINDIVLSSSITQSLKGIITAGLVKSIKYSSRKLYKMFLSLV